MRFLLKIYDLKYVGLMSHWKTRLKC